MKKTLAAVAVLGAFAGSAFAADVTLYGKVDLGVQYMNSNSDVLTAVKSDGVNYPGVENVKKDSWGLKSGSNSSSRFGIKGSEQIADGLTVGFQLEQGFTADDGKFSDDTQAFSREARLYIQTDFGEIGLGRMGGLDSGLGSYDVISKGYAFGTGWGSSIGNSGNIFLGESGRMDNVITYKSPSFAGVTVLAQASLEKSGSSDSKLEGTSDAERYYALGATGVWGDLTAALVFSTTDYARTWVNEDGTEDQAREDNSKVVTGYVAYDFGVVKPMLAAQYFDDLHVNAWANDIDTTEASPAGWAAKWLAGSSVKGYGVMLGATAPVAAGTLYAMAGYNDFETTSGIDVGLMPAGEVSMDKVEVDTFSFGIGYQYPLSKRTYVYTGAGYTKVSGDTGVKGLEGDTKTTEFVAGIVHNF